jgi:hypothetical protein
MIAKASQVDDTTGPQSNNTIASFKAERSGAKSVRGPRNHPTERDSLSQLIFEACFKYQLAQVRVALSLSFFILFDIPDGRRLLHYTLHRLQA